MFRASPTSHPSLYAFFRSYNFRKQSFTASRVTLTHSEMERLWDKTSTNPVASAVLLLLALTICVTRILTGLAGKPKYLNGEGLRSVGMLPYWIPFLGHLFSFIAKFEEFLQQTRYIVHLPYSPGGAGQLTFLQLPSIPRHLLREFGRLGP